MHPVSCSHLPRTILENSDLIISSVTQLVTVAARLDSLQQSKKITQIVNWDNLTAMYRTSDDLWHASTVFATNFHVVLLSHESNPTAEKTHDYVSAAIEILSCALTNSKLPNASCSLSIREVMQEMYTQEIHHFVKHQPLHQMSLELLIAEMIRLKTVFPNIKMHVFFELLCKEFVHRRLADKGNQYAWTQQEALQPECIQEVALEESARLEAKKQELLNHLTGLYQGDKRKRIEERLKEIDAQNDHFLIETIIRSEVERRIQYLDSFKFPQSHSHSLTTRSKAALETQLKHVGLTIEALEDVARISVLRTESIQEVYAMLDQWVTEGIKGEQREIAQWKILSFLANEKQNTLDLKGLQLTTFPPIFSPLFHRLTCLDMGKYEGYLSCNNHLVVIPDWIGELNNLKIFKLSGASIPLSLPESMKQLTNLKTFIGISIFASPDSFSSFLNGLKVLENLSLTICELTAVPESIFHLKALKYLDLSSNLLISFPQQLCSLVHLESLNLKNNRIDSIPETISHLQQVMFLNLQDNELENVPFEIIKLSPRCQVNFRDNEISPPVRNQICDIMDQTSHIFLPDIQGIMRKKIINRAGASDSITPLKTLLQELFAAAWLPFQYFPTLQNSDNEKTLRDWLNRLFGTADYELSGRIPYLIKVENRKSFARSVVKTMEQAEDNPAFLKVFLTIIKNMTASCEDSITLSCIYVRLEYGFATLVPNDVQGLADLLIKGVWAMQMIEEFAQNNIANLESLGMEPDPIEVYLDYFLTLKDPLQLPIDVSDMKYVSDVELEDVEIVKEYILNKQNEPNEVARFLINNDHWVAMLKHLYSDRYEAVEKEVATINTDGCVTDADYDEAEDKIAAPRIALTRSILQEIEAVATDSKGKWPE